MAQPSTHNAGVPDPYAAVGNAAQFTPPSNLHSANQTAEHFLSNYRLGKTLGIGSFGKVKIAEHVLTGHKVAIKILNRKKIQQMDMDEKARRELKILRLFMHPHIIRCYEVIETASDIYVVMEYVKCGELFDYIVEKGRLTEDEARRFFQQIISGVEYCHRNMVAHRDLKPENLLLDAKYNIKIADFGLSNVMRDGHFLKTSCGSPNYAAPEVISGKLYAGPEVDVWSCGVILYALLNGTLPFDDENIPNLFKKIKGGIYNMPQHLSAGARDLIPRMLVVDPLKRITIPEIRQHLWFTQKLPRYLAVMQADTMSGNPRIDEEMVNEVVRLGFDRDELITSLRNRVQNKTTVTYYLMVDNRKKMLSSGYLDAELNEAQPTQPLQSHHSTGHPGMSDAHHLQHPSTVSPVAGPSHSTPQRVLVERKWRLGLHTRGHPSALMAELYRALQANSISWKKLGQYTLKCRTVVRFTPSRLQQKVTPMAEDTCDDCHHLEAHLDSPSTMHTPMSPPMNPLLLDSLGSSGHSPTLPWARPDGRYDGGGGKVDEAGGDNGGATSVEYVLRFEAQMYKMKEEEYVIDFQRLEGPMYIYMDVCCHILTSITSTASSYMLLPSR